MRSVEAYSTRFAGWKAIGLHRPINAAGSLAAFSGRFCATSAFGRAVATMIV